MPIINKQDFTELKLKHFCAEKNIMQQRDIFQSGRKVSAKYIYDREAVFEIHKSFKKLNKKSNNQDNRWTNEMNRQDSSRKMKYKWSMFKITRQQRYANKNLNFQNVRH